MFPSIFLPFCFTDVIIFLKFFQWKISINLYTHTIPVFAYHRSAQSKFGIASVIGGSK